MFMCVKLNSLFDREKEGILCYMRVKTMYQPQNDVSKLPLRK